jgi:signal transduction histidine kinase
LAAAAVLVFGASFLLRPFSPSDDPGRSLRRLRDTASRIKEEFASLSRRQNDLLARLSARPIPADAKRQFERLQSLNLDVDIEGAAFTDEMGHPSLWLGNALDLEEVTAVPLAAGTAPLQRLVRSKASAYLIGLSRQEGGGFAAVYRLLAFTPPLKSPYLAEYRFLGSEFPSGVDLNFYDFRDPMDDLERFFSRNKDEFIGQEQPQGRIQQIFFPLRDTTLRIDATVKLSSPAPNAILGAREDAFRLAAYLLLLAALILTAVRILLRTGGLRRASTTAWISFLAVLATARLVLIPLGRLESIRGLPIFSPALAGFRSVFELTRSPAELFATALIFFLAITSAAVRWQTRPIAQIPGPRPLRRSLGLVISFAVSVATYPLFHALTAHLVHHSNINLLDFTPGPSFVLLHLTLLLVWLGAIVLQILILRRARLEHPSFLFPLFVLAALESAVFVFFGPRNAGLFGLQALAVGTLAWAAGLRRINRRQAGVVAAFLAQAFFLYASQATATAARSRMLASSFLRNNVQSLEPWAHFLLEESFPVLDRNAKSIAAFFRRPESNRNLAREIWNKTLLARFNWYSSLEIMTPEGGVLSRFSLNIPKIFRPAAAPASSDEWSVSRVTVPFMGKEREFLTAVKDWSDNGGPGGRTVLTLSLDPEMLSFLYSANPYFELLRVNTIPSLNGFDLRFAVFDRDGLLLFNPFKMSSGLPAGLRRSEAPPDPLGTWWPYGDKGRRFDLFAFSSENRVYAVFVPLRTWRAHAVGVIKLVLLYGLALGIPLLIPAFLSARRKGRPPLWSFSDRVFLSFLVVALIPLLMFAVFSRNFFGRLFAQQFVEKAEIHADLARGVMDDFLSLQGGEPGGPTTPPEDLVLLLSNTIGNDVNLYRDGRLAASSRREFFDAGILPELLDGEVYYRLREMNDPYDAQDRRIGLFTLRTLTVPYTGMGARYFLSLPFPFERQDIANAGQELIEFLVFISVFFIAVVLLLARGIGASIVTPVRRLLAGTREATLGNLEIELAYDHRDEMKTLIDGFNAMIRSLKEHQQDLAEMGKKAAWAEMARKVAHEIKNPLTPIQLSAEHILRVFEDGRGDFETALRESISYIVSEVENLRHIAQEFLEISREPLPRREPFGLDDLVRETVEPYRKLLAERIEIRADYEGSDFTLTGDRAKLKIALRNLLTNAIESIHGRGEIRARLEGRPEELRLSISDTGEGMERGVLERVFEPYFSTKDAGTGLGLPIAKKIVEDHGGTIQVASRPGQGTSIVLRWPRARS